jgi:cellobiose phosphorylase
MPIHGFGRRLRAPAAFATGEEPLRSELLNAEQLEDRGRELAGEHSAEVSRSKQDFLLPRLAENDAVIRDTCRVLADAIKDGHKVTPAGEWLLDNLYLIDEQVRMARRHLPAKYSWQLPILTHGVSEDLPRVYDIALNAVSHGDGRFDEDSLRRFMSAYQETTPLTLGELWAVPIMLRLALIENLRRVAARVRRDRLDRDVAAHWAGMMIDATRHDPTNLILVAADMAREQPPMTNSFVSELARRLQPLGEALSLPMTWINQRLAESGLTSAQLVQSAQHEQAIDQVSISNCMGSLRLLDALDWKTFVEAVSDVERILRRDPAGVYAQMDFATRNSYRIVIEQLARRSGLDELHVADGVVALAAEYAFGTSNADPRAHVGYYLVDAGWPMLEARMGVASTFRKFEGPSANAARFVGYIAAIGALTLCLLLPPIATLATSGQPWWLTGAVALCALVALSEVAVALMNRASAMFVGPRPLPRLDLRTGIPLEGKTIVVVPTMLSSPEDADRLADDLEVRYMANRDPNLRFALLTDLVDATSETTDSDAAIVKSAMRAVRRLNERHEEQPFLLLHRSRRWNAGERCWMGEERKRGKLADLNALLRGEGESRFSTTVGDLASLRDTRYVITLDTDTQLPRDAAREMISAMLHPLNQPRSSSANEIVAAGYAVLQPRVGSALSQDGASPYAALFGGDAGIDPYTRATSDTYQDLFAEGSFIGKGIYDVDAFERVLGQRFPENRILSHDLLEGCYVRAGLAADVEVYERYPQSYLVDAKRRHRWIRGDWQIAAWLLPRVPGPDATRLSNPLSALSRWKIFDNLRRSVVPIAVLGLLAYAWFAASSAMFWTVVVLEALLLPAIVDIALDLVRPIGEASLAQHLRRVASDATRRLMQFVFSVACLPFEAWQNLDAIARTLWRILVSRRRLLEWTTSGSLERHDRNRLATTFGAMWPAPAAAIVAFALLLQHPSLRIALPWLALWAFAPLLAWRVSKPPTRTDDALDASQMRFARNIARRIWNFFDRYVGAEDNWLPPDNHQEQPIVRTAHRTSPTNIGLYLLSNLAAHDLGYVSLRELLERTRKTLESMGRLARHRGHFYNWYDTTSLQPLVPHYVSTVDSGNLVAHLLTLRQGLLECLDAPVIGPQWLDGLDDTLAVAMDVAPAGEPIWKALARELEMLRGAESHSPRFVYAGLQRLAALARATDVQDATPGVRDWRAAIVRQIDASIADLVVLVPAAVDAADTSAIDAFPTLRELGRAGGGAQEAALVAIKTIHALADQCSEFSRADFAFLFDPARSLFTIGYNVSDRRADAGFYDLLASEARLGVFVAIAQGVVPQDAWFALGRLLTSSGGRQVLLSWSGSMFEYLMPQLVMPTYPRTLLDETCRAAIDQQIAYARSRGVPWGISESGYNVTDAAQNYQYRAFGVPGLGLQRGLSQELVIAPYATALALPFAPQAAIHNLERMAAEGWLADCGYYEAIDFTPARLPHGETSAVVRSYMAHHQGMSLLSILQMVRNRPMQRRFLGNPELEATMLLLQERIPRAAIDWASDPAMVDVRSADDAPQAAMRVFRQQEPHRPAVQLLTNGRYQLMVTHAGGGYSRWQDIAVTRWQEDATRDAAGVHCYLRDLESGKLWSNTPNPTHTAVDRSEAIFTEASVEFRRRLDEIEVHTQIVVSPEDDIELRRIRITNRSRFIRSVEVTSYAEIVLASAIADALHPAFSNLFVQTEILPERDAILATRRRASSDQPQHWMMHAMSLHGVDSLETSFETDRMAFIGRGNALDRPAALRHAGPLSRSAGAVLDPIAAVRHALRLQPDETAVLDLVIGVAATREQCMALVDKYRDRHLADRAIEIAWTHNRLALGQINISEIEAQTYGRLAGALLYADPARRALPSTIVSNRLAQPGLWPFAISGDLPIVLLQMSGAENLALVRQIINAHAYCRMKGLIFDLVIWNEERLGYRNALNDEIMAIMSTGPDAEMLERPGGVFVRSIEQLNHEDRILMQTVARAVFADSEGSLAEQMAVDRIVGPDIVVPRLIPTREREAILSPEFAAPATILDNGIGGYSEDGREYVMRIDAAQRTPSPWVNVIANPRFGCVVSESGSSYTWMDNAHEYRLTPWSNDPVSDASGEVFYIRDEESGHFWSPTPLPAAGAGRYVVRHGFGYSIFEHREEGLSSHLRIHVDPDAPVKFFMLRLRNESGRTRKLSITGYVEWVLGDLRNKTAMHVVTELDTNGALLARNAYSIDFPGQVAFFDVDNPQRTMSGDRTEFIGRNGSLRNPAAMGRQTLSGRLGASMDPCGAIQIPLELVDGETRDFIFRLGAGSDRAEAVALVQRFRRNGTARASIDATHARWQQLLGAVQVRSPDPTLDVLVNGWLPYQVISCRLWGRSGFYQSGGAFGFRDQLQDAMAAVHADPTLLRKQILLCASRQFVEGDVQHWWHPPGGRGVRTLCSDDYLWLPLAVARYIHVTGDTDVLGQSIGFLEGRQLNPGEESYYDMPLTSAQSADLYEHCRRAIVHALDTGAHGLPLIGCGDWNDGMNNVGRHGKGESVWLGFFLYQVLNEFIGIAGLRSDSAFARRCAEHAEQLKGALDEHAWDGEWYLRAFFDDGTPLGSSRNTECRIDAISQSWAMLSNAGAPARVEQALDSLDRHLVDETSRLIRLLDPPFDISEPDPGYIRGYLPGVRENGGQYTHAAVWTVMAFIEAGRIERAWQLFDLINPVRHGSRESDLHTYRVEPYVCAADVLSIDPHRGRGGWTWYTGSAGWMYRLVLESMLGVRREGSKLFVEPQVPAEWSGFSLVYRHDNARYEITVSPVDGAPDETQQHAFIALDQMSTDTAQFRSNGRSVSIRKSDA